ncbi:hypothetical protein LPJ64_006120 [Coemansia asiatica]|uniref:Uncharacterized protein n=1 Tax=Coemansia asiatica TaxID=1052880 RepID=A0A9W7XF61_9FUNG|nr:hypothetical protein LPJ64_006120 [Coemansia asiatica]
MVTLYMVQAAETNSVDLDENPYPIDYKKASKTVTKTKSQGDKCVDDELQCVENAYYRVCSNGQWSDTKELQSDQTCEDLRSSISSASPKSASAVAAAACAAIIMMQLF